MAQEYADRYLKGIQYADPSDYEFYCDVLKSIYLDGYTACEQSIWHSIIEEEYPEENKTALCRLDDGEFIVAICIMMKTEAYTPCRNGGLRTNAEATPSVVK